MKRDAMASARKTLPKMMLGFVVRRCAVALGHQPSPEEFAAWANAHMDGDRAFSLFGRPITAREAGAILRHPARVVSARGARPHECTTDEPADARTNVTVFRAAVQRLKERRRK